MNYVIFFSGLLGFIIKTAALLLLFAAIFYGRKYPVLKTISLIVFVALPLAFAGGCLVLLAVLSGPGHM